MARMRSFQENLKNMKSVWVGICAFADGIVMCVESEEGPQGNNNLFEEELVNCNLKINNAKTKVITVAKTQQTLDI